MQGEGTVCDPMLGSSLEKSNERLTDRGRVAVLNEFIKADRGGNAERFMGDTRVEHLLCGQEEANCM